MAQKVVNVLALCFSVNLTLFYFAFKNNEFIRIIARKYTLLETLTFYFDVWNEYAQFGMENNKPYWMSLKSQLE